MMDHTVAFWSAMRYCCSMLPAGSSQSIIVDRRGLHGRWTRAVLGGVEAAAAALEGEAAEASAQFRESTDQLAVMGLRLDLALAYLDRVAVAADMAEAERAAGEARPIIDQLGAAALSQRLDGLLAQAAARCPSAAFSGSI